MLKVLYLLLNIYGCKQEEFEQRQGGKLETVITIMSRPVRIVKGHAVAQSVDESLFHEAEERELYAAAKAAASEVHKTMSIPAFLEVLLPGPFPTA